MKLLAIETSSSACSVALLHNDEIKAIHQIAPMRQAQLILGMIEDLLLSAGITLQNLDALAFGCGPGSFTGVRIATGVMQGIAFATDLPLISVSSLAALAQSAYDNLGWKNLLVAVDARMQELYWAAYQVDQNNLVQLIGDEIICAPENIIIPSAEEWFGVGSGWKEYGELITIKNQAANVEITPTAAAVARLAKEKYLQKEWVTPENALPVYLRNNVAVKKNR